MEDMKIYDFLLVNLKYDAGTKKETVKTFVASVACLNPKKNKSKITCKFLKKNIKSTSFLYKDIIVVYDVLLSDIEMKLSLKNVRRG